MSNVGYLAAIKSVDWQNIQREWTSLYIAGYCRYDDRYGVERKTRLVIQSAADEFLPCIRAPIHL